MNALATALIVEQRNVYAMAKRNGDDVPLRSAWYLVHVQDGLQLFGCDSFYAQVGDGFIKAFRGQFSREWNVQDWPKVILDDGGFLARLRKQTVPAFRDEPAVVRFLSGTMPERVARAHIEQNRKRFLGVDLLNRITRTEGEITHQCDACGETRDDVVWLSDERHHVCKGCL